MTTQSQSGFSLTEILIVVALMVLMAAGAVFKYGPMQQRIILHSAARRLAGDLRLAQQRAILDGAEWLWELDTDGFGYKLSSKGMPYVYKGVEDFRFDENRTIHATPPISVTFDALGRPAGGSDTRLVLTNDADSMYVCVRTTGRVDIAKKTC